MKKSDNLKLLGLVTIPGMAMLSFSHFMAELFGQTIPSMFLSFFKEAGLIIIAAAALLFVVAWLFRAIPRNRTKNYQIISFDVFGKQNKIEGLRTEFKTHDAAWSFMKEYKKSYPLYGFALVSDTLSNDEKKTIIRYI
ncbi:hypothetical protein AAA799E16_01789 [Marine Group I thaumarchaeote SCGC AAA799-E16]|uniref:Uncharacterized protein n=4 Tax=Marine Group I TaxID=905826 RepID=A0A081RL99_9ARCH|nr:hypothetical protein AAA799N04_01607 [Marine Group I thaumarchaeote SCGC AAA799-N04]KER05550.1 hypothetical protein AAA799E16_01789 [Marine Group I thaumarchaeote SCGC AAA799-E16]KFM15615.1 hypothetical protein AAA799D11_01134 [Marine Group I thaumarchaeote SCGC AAA799-D11]KFM15778.1 hypothetical protein SCCGRSA3_02573 [Marine Group I thaumarchaeote SCGC RSA3]